jgi:hypothetical protein
MCDISEALAPRVARKVGIVVAGLCSRLGQAGRKRTMLSLSALRQAVFDLGNRPSSAS